MGQYYQPYLRFIGGRKLTHDPNTARITAEKGISVEEARKDPKYFDYSSGSKLTEHSWMGNSFVDSVLWELRTPANVAWVGDYADDAGCPADVYGYVWSNNKDSENDSPLDEVVDMGNGAGYLVNEDKREYIDMREWYRSHVDKDKWCIHPLPLLTAVGNGMGGGDYTGYGNPLPDEDRVGDWAFSLLFFTEREPEGYRDMTHGYNFTSDC